MDVSGFRRMRPFVTLVALTALLLPVLRAEENLTRELSVTTLNIAKMKYPDRVLAEWRAHPEIWNSDLILLQEVPHFAGARPSVAESVAREMDRYVVSAASIPGIDVDGLSIISRFPLADTTVIQLPHNNMLFHTRKRIAVAVTVEAPRGPVRVINVHLDSRINKGTRLRQLAPVLAEARRWDGPCLIGGDFNTNYLRWVANVMPAGFTSQARALHAAMAAEHFTTFPTATGPTSDFPGLHLDWIYARHIEIGKAAIQPLKFTDHHAVRVQLTGFAPGGQGALAAESR